jgi:hypothetical protein
LLAAHIGTVIVFEFTLFALAITSLGLLDIAMQPNSGESGPKLPDLPVQQLAADSIVNGWKNKGKSDE